MLLHAALLLLRPLTWLHQPEAGVFSTPLDTVFTPVVTMSCTALVRQAR